MENEELELAALEAELAALELKESKVDPVPEVELKSKPKRKKPIKVVPLVEGPEVKVAEATPVRRAKLPRPLRQKGGDRQRGIRYRD